METFQILFYNLSTMFGCLMLFVIASWNKKVKIKLDTKMLVLAFSQIGILYMIVFIMIGALIKALLS